MENNEYTINDLINIVKRLRGENGCPWDKVQTHESLKRCLIEEAYEVCEAIDYLSQYNQYDNLCEELGDVLLQIIMHCEIASEEGLFSIDEVITEISKKMIRRHPNVFINENYSNKEMTWDEIKKQENKSRVNLKSELGEVPIAFPALIRAGKVIKKLNKRNEKINNKVNEKEYISQIMLQLDKLREESIEKQEIEKKIGDILFEITRYCEDNKISAEECLVNRIEQVISNDNFY